ncbi:MAG: pentapeptide repeat-containing protein, partial [Deltaproteobacteria bacterium]|nr:pentapeptide repeat-containing protein [Deltaproteobacteria bacterium]
NPVGKGYQKDKTETKRKGRPLPNIEEPDALIDSPRRRPEPAGLGPLGRMWELRQGKMGKYKGNYLKQRWPWFPEDFDWGHYNAAPPPMQLEGYLRGDERLYFENLHPRHPQYESWLPGLRVRCFLNHLTEPETDQKLFDEAPMKLDTLWVDMEAEKLILVWRGWAKVLSEDYEEVKHVFIVSESIDEPARSVEEYHILLQKRLSGIEQEPELAPEEPDEMVTRVIPAFKEPATKAKGETAGEVKTEKPKGIDPAAMEAQVAAFLAQAGIDVKSLPPEVREKMKEEQSRIIKILNEEDPAKIMEEEQKKMEGQLADELSQAGIDIDNLPPLSDKAKAEQLRLMKELGLEEADIMPDPGLVRFWGIMGALLPKMGMDPENLAPLIKEAKKHQARLKEPFGIGTEEEKKDQTAAEEKKATPPLTREVVEERVARGESFAGENFRGLDLSGLKMKGIDFSGAIFTGVVLKDTELEGANLSAADLKGADLSGTILTGANLAGANLSGAKMEKACLKDADATEGSLTYVQMAGAVLTDAVFEKAVMSKAVLDQVEAKDANFSEADLSGATFKNSDLSGADFSRCMLHNTDFQGANLSEASVEGAVGIKTNFREANLTELRASEGCDFSNGCFVKATGPGSMWGKANLPDADFSYSRMEGSDFTKAKLEGANLYAANMKFSRFNKADLRRAKLVRMNLFEGSLEKANLTETDLRGSNLYGAEFLEAVLDRTILEGANLKMTKLKKG